MQRIAFSTIAGFLIIALSLLAIVGWYAHIPIFITALANYNSITFNSCLCFVFLGIALLLPGYSLTVQRIRILLGIVILLFATFSFSQTLFGYQLGIDEFFMKAWLLDKNPHPGRMGGITAIALIFLSISLLMLPYSRLKVSAVIVQMCIFTVLILGLSALLGYLLGLEMLYSWYQHVSISLQSSISIALAGMGLWSLWNHHPNCEKFYFGREDKKIFVLSGIVLACVALLAGVVGFSLYMHSRELSFTKLFLEISPIVLFGIIIGMSLLYWQVLPLVQKVLHSDRELNESNERLKESENRFRSAFDSAAIGMALVSISGQYLRVNSALCHILGYNVLQPLVTKYLRYHVLTYH